MLGYTGVTKMEAWESAYSVGMLIRRRRLVPPHFWVWHILTVDAVNAVPNPHDGGMMDLVTVERSVHLS